jgi:hypothetical protein
MHLSRVGVVALIILLRATAVAEYWKWPFPAPKKKLNLKPTRANFRGTCKIDGLPSRPKFIMIGQRVAAPRLGEFDDRRNRLLCCPCAQLASSA